MYRKMQREISNLKKSEKNCEGASEVFDCKL